MHGDVSRRVVKEFQIGDIEIPDCERSNGKYKVKQRASERETVKQKRDVIGWTWTWANSTVSYSLSI